MKNTFPKIMASLADQWPVPVAIGLIVFGIGAGLVGGQTASTAAPVTPFWPAMAIGVVLILIGAAVIAAPLIAVFINRRKTSVQPNPTPAPSNAHTNDED
jgi:hypothetical protein